MLKGKEEEIDKGKRLRKFNGLRVARIERIVLRRAYCVKKLIGGKIAGSSGQNTESIHRVKFSIPVTFFQSKNTKS